MKDFLPVTSQENGNKRSQDDLSRREFLKLILCFGGGVAVSAGAVQPFSIENLEESGEDRKENPLASYTETAVMQSLVMGAEYLTASIFKKLKIRHGNQTMSWAEMVKYLKDKPIEGLIRFGVYLPVFEEAIFRAMPSDFINRRDMRDRWDVGIPISTIFALAHNVKRDEFKGLQLVKSVPITQFMAGMFYWYLMREKGYSHAVMAHSMGNTIPLAIGALLFKIYPPEKAEKTAREVFGVT